MLLLDISRRHSSIVLKLHLNISLDSRFPVNSYRVYIDINNFKMALDKPYDFFLSHCWGTDTEGRNNHGRAKLIFQALKEKNFKYVLSTLLVIQSTRT